MNGARARVLAAISFVLLIVGVYFAAAAWTSTDPDDSPAVEQVQVDDPDRCVPPPSGDGPWVEWDDGDPCVLDPWTETWVEEDDADTYHQPRTQQARRAPVVTPRATARVKQGAPAKQAAPVKERRPAPTGRATAPARPGR